MAQSSLLSSLVHRKWAKLPPRPLSYHSVFLRTCRRIALHLVSNFADKVSFLPLTQLLSLWSHCFSLPGGELVIRQNTQVQVACLGLGLSSIRSLVDQLKCVCLHSCLVCWRVSGNACGIPREVRDLHSLVCHFACYRCALIMLQVKSSK